MGSQHAGLFELFRPSEGPINVDVVAVHGLQGDAIRTWTHEKSQVCWLRDLLPAHIQEARVLSWGYLANTNSWDGKATTSDRILHHAETLIEELQIDREAWAIYSDATFDIGNGFETAVPETLELANAPTRPIIFICHSLGGIIVKRVLTLAAGRTSAKNSRLHLVYTCTYGILFFGTPHNGSGMARPAKNFMKFASAIVPRKIARFETSLLSGLEQDSETLQNITQDFASLMARYHVFFFWEQLPTDLKYSKDCIVKRDSAAPVIDGTDRCGIAANHQDMCKFESFDSHGFKIVIAALKRYMQAAPGVVENRIEESARMLGDRRRNEALELIRDSKLSFSFDRERRQGLTKSRMG